MAGLIGLGNQYRQLAMQGLQQAAEMQRQREHANTQLKEQERAGMMQNVGVGAGVGAMMAKGTALGGPWGAAIGAAIGFLTSKLF